MASSPIRRLHHLHWASVHCSCLHVWSELEFWRTHCGFSISTCSLSCRFRALEAASFLQPQEPSLLLHTFLLQFPHLSAFTELRRVGVLLCIRLWLPRMWLAWSSIQTAQTFSISAVRLFLRLINVYTEAVLLISFRNFSFAFTARIT